MYRGLLHATHVLAQQVRLHKSIRYGVPLNPAQVVEANDIDDLCTTAMLTAEKTVQETKHGRHVFLPGNRKPTP